MFSLALNTMAALFLCIGIGYFAIKRKMIKTADIDVLNSLVLNITMPCMMIAVFNIELTEKIRNIIPQMFLYGILYNLLLLIMALILVKFIKITPRIRKILITCFFITNAGFIGLPLIASVLGKEALVYATLLTIPLNFFTFTVGVYILQPEGENHISIMKILTTPSMVGIWIGLFILLSQLVWPFTFESNGTITRLPSFLSQTVNMIGAITAPLAMFIVGASLSQTNFKKVLLDGKLHIYSILKLVIAPIIGYYVFGLFVKEDFILSIIVLFIGLPTGTIVAIIAEQFKQDYVYASEVVLITTIYSLVTIPMMFIIFG